MKRIIAIAGMLLILVSLPSMAQQGPGGKRYGKPGPGRQMPPRQAPAQDAAFQQREMPRDGRMSPEERRQLRRDVHDHGREIYRERPGPGRR